MVPGVPEIPAWIGHRSPRWLPLVLLLAVAVPAGAEQAATVDERTDLSRIPVEGVDPWTRIGEGHVLLDAGRLVCNDNSNDHIVAFQGMLGRVEAAHAVEVSASMDVISNIGGQAALIEVSRPGLELIVQLHRDRIDVAEREGSRLRWLATAAVDLTVESVVTVRKASSREDERETLSVAVDGVELVRCAGRGAGTLGIGRVVFGSLGYQSMGASRWSWIEVHAEVPTVDPAVPSDVRSFGRFKSGFGR